MILIRAVSRYARGARGDICSQSPKVFISIPDAEGRHWCVLNRQHGGGFTNPPAGSTMRVYAKSCTLGGNDGKSA